ncbi:MAG: type I polyketide synthase, partial [bacterium]|nr:type I polyketide synthase [bacterium]
TNIGHLDATAGIAGFVKTVLTLKHKQIPPSLHYETPNPEIDFQNSPFYVNTTLKEWKTNNQPLRAGVSSFGIGGTNAHIILEETPPKEPAAPGKEYQLFVLSAKTPTALDKITAQLGDYLKRNPEINPADAAYTLQKGRETFPHRRMFACKNNADAAEILTNGTPGGKTFAAEKGAGQIVFMFPGQGAQYIDMGKRLYHTEDVFRSQMDRGFKILKPIMEIDIKELLYPENRTYKPEEGIEDGKHKLEKTKEEGTNHPVSNIRHPASSPHSASIRNTEITQPLIFLFEYALAQQLISWGITPDTMIGHSIGEYTAACLAGVFSLEDALKLVVMRGRLMQRLPKGAMLGIALTEKELEPMLDEKIQLAAVNSSELCVVSGTEEDIENFTRRLETEGKRCSRLETSHAFHSYMMDPVLKEFEETVKKIKRQPPQIPYISNITGETVKDEDAVSPTYWANHIRQTVKFSQGLEQLLSTPGTIFVEVGPGRSLSTSVRRHEAKTAEHQVVNLVGTPREKIPDTLFLTEKIGELWLYGVNIDWDKYHAGRQRNRVSLPTYAFDKHLFKIIPDTSRDEQQEETGDSETPAANIKNQNISQWFYIPSWKRLPFLSPTLSQANKKNRWMLLAGTGRLDALVEKRLLQLE